MTASVSDPMSLTSPRNHSFAVLEASSGLNQTWPWADGPLADLTYQVCYMGMVMNGTKMARLSSIAGIHPHCPTGLPRKYKFTEKVLIII